MSRKVFLAILIAGLCAATSSAQEGPWRFQWQKGRLLTYRAQHNTTVTETVDGNKVETGSKLTLVKLWKIVDVDANGIATLQLSLGALRHEQVRPNGEKLLFDSNDLDKSTPELKPLAEHVGKTLAVLRMDVYGRIIEVKQGSAAKYEAEPPFVLVLPAAAPKVGQAWLRPFNVTLEPPQGTGEKYKAQQMYTCAKIANGQATLTITTEVKDLPTSMQERLPLLQKEIQGQAVFDITSGRLQRVQFNIDKTVQNHQGPGSTYQFVSAYAEELANTQ